MRLRSGTTCAVAWALSSIPLTAQAPALGLREAVERALAREPGIVAADAERDAASATIDVARQAYWPRVDGLAQINRATHNNVAGLLFPQAVLSPVSGPPSVENSWSTVWGSALGALVTWEPFDFGAREQGVEAARRAAERAVQTAARTRLETAAIVADTYLGVLAGRQTVRAAQAALTRAEALTTVVEALVNAELRPGVDLSNARAEQAAAAIQVIQARRATDASLALLRRFAGDDALPLDGLPGAAPGDTPATVPAAAHPAILERQASAEEAAARLEAARRAADPHLAVQGTIYGRGSGVLDGNTSGRGADGLGLGAYNWATGVTVTVPITEWFARGSKQEVEAARVRAAAARRDETVRELTRRASLAALDLEATRALSRQMPTVVEAARAAHAQATARYRAGLSSIVEVADAQRRLAQADIDAGIVDLSAWRARLALAAVTSRSAEEFVGTLPGAP